MVIPNTPLITSYVPGKGYVVEGCAGGSPYHPYLHNAYIGYLGRLKGPDIGCSEVVRSARRRRRPRVLTREVTVWSPSGPHNPPYQVISAHYQDYADYDDPPLHMVLIPFSW